MFGLTPARSNTFRKWVELEKKKSDFISAAESDEFPEKVFAYLSAAGYSTKGDWRSTVLSLQKAYVEYLPKSLPILDAAPKEGKPVDWDYDNRTWNFYSHLLAKSYGWTLEYIAELETNEALGHLQEILTEDHLEKEFVYSLSEVAYPYNKSTKKSEFKPMKRPYWMKPVINTEIKKFKIKRDMLPMGKIVDISGLPPQYQIEGLETEKIKP